MFESRSGRLLESPGHRLFLGLFAVAEQHVTSSAAGVLNATTPLWTLVIAFATGHERRISAFKAAGFVIGMAGTLLIFSPWRSGGQIASAGGLAASASTGSATSTWTVSWPAGASRRWPCPLANSSWPRRCWRS